MGGYARDNVDELLEQVARAIDAGRSPELVIRDVQFRGTRGRGYHRRDVDECIALLRTATDAGGVPDQPFPPQGVVAQDAGTLGPSSFLKGNRREQKRRERAAEWTRRSGEWAKLQEFPSLPGTHIRCRRPADAKNTYEFYPVGASTPVAVACNPSKTLWDPTEIALAGIPYVVKRRGWTANTRRTEVIDPQSGRPVLAATGEHFDRSSSTRVYLTEDRVLSFPVEGESPWSSEMRAIDGEGKTWIRFRGQISREKVRNDVERVLIQKALARFGGNVSHASKALGLSRSALYRRLQKYSL